MQVYLGVPNINIIMPIRGEAWCETLRVRVANPAIYAHSGKMQDTIRSFPGLAYNLYPKAGNNTFIMRYSLTKVCPFRLGNKELPPTWGYGRPIPNTSITRICPAVLSAIYFLHQSVLYCMGLLIDININIINSFELTYICWLLISILLRHLMFDYDL